MATGKVRKPRNPGTGSDPIAAYAKAQPPASGAMCDHLRTLIDAALPKTTSKVWHGSPVWFDGENPIVGYSAKKAAVSLMFWNGQAMGAPALKPVGKYGAAEALFTDGKEIDPKEVRRWLTWAKANVFDSVGFFERMKKRGKKG
jgi:hypothetical protein